MKFAAVLLGLKFVGEQDAITDLGFLASDSTASLDTVLKKDIH